MPFRSTITALALALFVGLAAGLSARADQVDDDLDAARIKARAGKHDEALALVDALVGRHEDDPRGYVERARILRDLDRPREAADATERARALLAAWRKSAPAGAVKEVDDGVAALAGDLLGYRDAARSEIEAYRTKALVIARRLLDAGREWEGLFILDELVQVASGDDAEIAALVASVDAAVRRDYEGWKAEGPATTDELDADAKALLDRNLDAARRALRSKDWAEARLSAKAALEVSPEDVAALLALAEAHAGAGRDDDAVRAVLRALGAPKGEGRRARSQADRVVRELGKLSADLEEFAEARAETARAIIRQRKKAARAASTHDAEWLGHLASRIAPADPTVVDAVGDEVARRTGRLPRTAASAKAAAAAREWVVVFRADDPALWDTDTDEGEDRRATRIETAARSIRYLRLRRLDTDEAVIVAVTHADLAADGDADRYSWQGSKHAAEGALHLGIDDANRKWTFRDGGRIMISARGCGGWGFGHKVHANDTQYWSWASHEIGRTVFEVAVTARDLSEEERRLLLAGD